MNEKIDDRVDIKTYLEWLGLKQEIMSGKA